MMKNMIWIVVVGLMMTGCGNQSSIINQSDNIGQDQVSLVKFEHIDNGDAINTTGVMSEKTFLEGIGQIETGIPEGYEPLVFDGDKVSGGIIPHHLVANCFISDFYKAVSEKQDYDKVVLISPNHFTRGPRVLTVMDNFSTYAGVVKTDSFVTASLIEEGFAGEADRAYIEMEHGQLAHIPYIGYYFPEAEVIPIMLAETRDLNGIKELAIEIDRLLGDSNLSTDQVLYVASIDFSHYLNLEEANEKDVYTRTLLETNDYMAMSSLSNDYIDSPSSYGLLMELLGLKGQVSCKITNHSNAAIISDQLMSEETTSYFQVLYEVD